MTPEFFEMVNNTPGRVGPPLERLATGSFDEAS